MLFRQFARDLQRLWLNSRNSVSVMIALICIALYVVIELLSMLNIVDKAQSAFVLGLSYAGIFHHHLFYQFLTAPLLHFNLPHLAFNMLTLWMLGPDIERRLGRRSYVVFSVVCGLSGNAGILLFDRGTGYITGGYSSVIFGILIAQAIYFPNRLIYIYAFFPVKMKYAALILAAVEIGLSFERTQGWTAHSAHFFGAAAGWVFLQFRRPGVISDDMVKRIGQGDHRIARVSRKPSRHVGTIGAIGPPNADPRAVSISSVGLEPLTLLFANGVNSGMRFTIRDKPLTLGRGPSCDIKLSDDHKVSRIHAKLVLADHGCMIIDAGSRNGVFVNGSRVERTLLRPGDMICLGSTKITVNAGRG